MILSNLLYVLCKSYHIAVARVFVVELMVLGVDPGSGGGGGAGANSTKLAMLWIVATPSQIITAITTDDHMDGLAKWASWSLQISHNTSLTTNTLENKVHISVMETTLSKERKNLKEKLKKSALPTYLCKAAFINCTKYFLHLWLFHLTKIFSTKFPLKCFTWNFKMCISWQNFQLFTCHSC